MADAEGGGEAAPVAVLFARKNSHYKTIEGCDVYDEERDALTWRGGVPGVFHPPCRMWSQLSHFVKTGSSRERELALWSVDMARRFGGVVEHPYNSRLWEAAGCGSYGVRDEFGGVLVPMMQRWFGHRAEKKTCLYVVGPVPVLPWAEVGGGVPVEKMGRAERERTPFELALFLVDLARRCGRSGPALRLEAVELAGNLHHATLEPFHVCLDAGGGANGRDRRAQRGAQGGHD